MPLDKIVLITLILLISMVILAAIGSRLRLPYAILLVLGGGLIGLIPALPHIELQSELILVIFLPPLIYTAAWFTSWRDFRNQLDFILLLAIGLVLATLLAVAFVAHTFIPGLPWAVAFVLGAVVSPTDTVAASSIIQGQGLIRRIAAVIEGESLVNDATGLVAYRFAIAAAVSGTFSLTAAGLQFVIVSIGGILMGLILALGITWLHRQIEDTTTQIIITIITPFAAYLIAEALGLSGVLATVAAGLYLGRQSATFFSSETRLQGNSFWNVLVFISNSFIFLLIGLQLPNRIANLGSRSIPTILGHILMISLTVIGVRLAWTFACINLLRILPRAIPHLRPGVSWRYALVISWAGMRGGVSLAAALAIPTTVANGTSFPKRDLLIFITFGVILFTLLVQGLTLGPLIRWLKVDHDPTIKRETQAALIASTQVALKKLDELKNDEPSIQKYIDRLRSYYERKLALIEQNDEEVDLQKLQRLHELFGHVQKDIHNEERNVLIAMRNKGEINDEVFHKIEQNLDIEEQRFYR
ncbi:Na+/H+ antiporter [Dictyobacter kobayashii]|uniref:Na+/H+ antiporter n=1 Tax=Dictyobacter kobayashii TaxID=2014872 RepID=A0A402AU36_9CHLR|nr:Na+/H+ antiporter [Dictyobacter kobayashii]GCE22585.1 Na+/H+ antiporter [Dictyobacter kobayashii]